MTHLEDNAELAQIELEEVDDELASGPPPRWYESEAHDDLERYEGVEITDEEQV